MAKDEEGRNVLTDEFVVAVCEFNGQYTTPVCNSQLYLHYKGFEKIENLDRYTKVKSIWLECNGINKIQGLDHMIGLRCLYLHQNKIKRMENLTFFPKLVILNLSHNQIERVEGLDNCMELQTLDLSHNLITSVADCEQLRELPKLAHLDLKNNQIDDTDNVVPFIGSLPAIVTINMLNNPCRRMLAGLRR